MSQSPNLLEGSQDLATSAAEDAEWHPFSVWRSKFRSTADASSHTANETDDADWDPYSVWKKQIKRA